MPAGNRLDVPRPQILSLNLSATQAAALAQIGRQLLILAGAAPTGGPACVPAPAAPDGMESPTVTRLINEFLRAKARAGRSDRYLRALRNSLVKFSLGRAGRLADSITVQEIEKWLYGSAWAPRTQRGYLGDVRTLYNFGKRRGLASVNPAAGVELPVLEPGPVTVHTPAQVKMVLEFARSWDLNVCRALAVRYFAGLRSSEVALLEEKDIHQGHVEITAANAKTRRRRIVPIPANLAPWLALGGVLPVKGSQSNIWRDFTAALARARAVPWRHNVTRHSFCSYHLARWRNAAKTALLAGHTEQTLFAHYREVVTSSAARSFWAILPEPGQG